MRIKSALLFVAACAITLCASDLFAQKEFDEAHEKIASYWNEKNPIPTGPVKRAKIAKDASELPLALKALINSGILRYLDTGGSVSADELTIKIAKALAYPYMTVNDVADADGSVSVIPLPQQDAYAIAYDISTCIVCAKGWVEIAARRDNHWLFTAQLDKPKPDTAVHLGLVGSKTEHLLALYGVHFGDAHNRLDVRLYSVRNGITRVWSSLNLPGGEIEIRGNRMTLRYRTSLARTYREKQQVYEVDGQQIRLLQTEMTDIKH